MIYLDNAATSFPKPPCVGEAMAKFLAEDAANPGRAGHRMAVAAERMIDQVRLALVRMFDAPDPARLIFTLNCTDALNVAIKGVMREGDHVVTTTLEHNSVSRPLRAMADAGVVRVTKVSPDGEGFVDPSAVKRAIEPDTRLVVMTHCSNVLGTIQPAAEVGAICREADVLFLLDAAQTAGIVPISVGEMNVDLLAFPGHKSLLGPPGTGGLYVGERAYDGRAGTLRAWREGGTGGDSANVVQPAELPHYLEAGTHNTVGVRGLGAAVGFLREQAEAGVDLLAAERAHVARVIDALADDDRFTIHGSRDPDRHVGTLSVSVTGCDPAEVGGILDESFDIAVRPGLHCAPFCHREIGTFPDGTVRISPGPFTTDGDIEALLQALREIAGGG